jgi:hypothetical protein
VVDVLNTRVQKFDPFGNYISDIGSWGVLPGQLFRPKGVAIDRRNRVFVSDSYTGLIQIFTDFGRFLGVVCENNKKLRYCSKKSGPKGHGFELPLVGATKPDPVTPVRAPHETISYHGECEPQNRRTKNRRISK